MRFLNGNDVHTWYVLPVPSRGIRLYDKTVVVIAQYSATKSCGALRVISTNPHVTYCTTEARQKYVPDFFGNGEISASDRVDAVHAYDVPSGKAVYYEVHLHIRQTP